MNIDSWMRATVKYLQKTVKLGWHRSTYLSLCPSSPSSKQVPGCNSTIAGRLLGGVCVLEERLRVVAPTATKSHKRSSNISLSFKNRDDGL